MSYAIVINHPNQDESFKCNICSEVIEPNKIIGLKCNYKKHIFCFQCINDWFMETRFNIKSSYKNNYQIVRMCPICRKNGGYLPFIDDNFHNDIHYKGEIKKTCGYALRNKNVYCMKFGHSKYNHRCKIHFDIENKKNIKLNHDNLIK
jgi:hypothetical protein